MTILPPLTISAERLAVHLAGLGPHALLDVRERGEYALEHIPTACPLPRGLVEVCLPGLVPWQDTPLVLYCDDGHRSALAAQTCLQMGYRDVAFLSGGMSAWLGEGNDPEYGVNVFGKTHGERLIADNQVAQMEVAELAELDRDEVILLDSRTASEYGKGHIPGAINLPSGEMPRALLALPQEWRESKTVVVHCAGRTRSILGAKMVADLGFKRAYALRNGTMAWQMAGQSLERTRNPWPHTADPNPDAQADAFAARYVAATAATSMTPQRLAHLLDKEQAPYLLDVRQDEEWHAGSITGARQCAVGQLANAADEVIAVRGAPIVCLSNTGVRARLGAALLTRIGYPDVHWLAGGLTPWRAAGETLTAPAELELPTAADLRSQARLSDAQELQSEIETGTARVVDVRRSSEYALAHIPGSVWIPRGDLERRADALGTPDVPMVVVSDRAIRASLAARTLGALGFSNVRVLADGLAVWTQAGGKLEEGLAGADVSLREAKEDAELVAQRPRLLERNREDMERYLDWEERLGEQFADGS